MLGSQEGPRCPRSGRTGQAVPRGAQNSQVVEGTEGPQLQRRARPGGRGSWGSDHLLHVPQGRAEGEQPLQPEQEESPLPGRGEGGRTVAGAYSTSPLCPATQAAGTPGREPGRTRAPAGRRAPCCGCAGGGSRPQGPPWGWEEGTRGGPGDRASWIHGERRLVEGTWDLPRGPQILLYPGVTSLVCLGIPQVSSLRLPRCLGFVPTLFLEASIRGLLTARALETPPVETLPPRGLCWAAHVSGAPVPRS